MTGIGQAASSYIELITRKNNEKTGYDLPKFWIFVKILF